MGNNNKKEPVERGLCLDQAPPSSQQMSRQLENQALLQPRDQKVNPFTTAQYSTCLRRNSCSERKAFGGNTAAAVGGHPESGRTKRTCASAVARRRTALVQGTLTNKAKSGRLPVSLNLLQTSLAWCRTNASWWLAGWR